jgi:bacteriocin biosynthesis cyclodehydratase domain-containing protein
MSLDDFDLRFKPHLEILRASDRNVYILRGDVRAEFVVEQATPAEHALLDLLEEGADAPDELLAALRARVPDAAGDDAALLATLEELAGMGLLEERRSRVRAELGDDAAERLDRQLAYFSDVRPGAAARTQSALKASRVLMLGVGGLGTWTAAALACAGVGHLTLVDDDRVELSNLNRQMLFRRADIGRPKVEAAADALTAFDPELSVDARRERVAGPRDAERVVEGHDYIVELADWPPYELSRWMDTAAWAAGVPHVTAALAPPTVRIGPTYLPGRTACLACLEESARAGYPLYDELVELRRSRPAVAPTLGPPCALIGGVIAMDVVHHLAGLAEPATLGRALLVDIRDMSVTPEEIVPREDCPRCGAGATPARPAPARAPASARTPAPAPRPPRPGSRASPR